MPVMARLPDMDPPVARQPHAVSMTSLALGLDNSAAAALRHRRALRRRRTGRPRRPPRRANPPPRANSPRPRRRRRLRPSSSTVIASLPLRKSIGPLGELDDSLAWHRVGTIKAFLIDSVVGFGGGYVGGLTVRRPLVFRPTAPIGVRSGCPSRFGEPIDVAAKASSLIIVGGAVDPGCDSGADTSGHCPGTPVSWWSDDGVAWHASNRTNGVDPMTTTTSSPRSGRRPAADGTLRSRRGPVP